MRRRGMEQEKKRKKNVRGKKEKESDVVPW